MDRRPRDNLILCRQHTFLTLAGVEPIRFAISIDDLPSVVNCHRKSEFFSATATVIIQFICQARLSSDENSMSTQTKSIPHDCLDKRTGH
jgi:hypothetical protein